MRKIWTLEAIQEEANKYETRVEFRKNKKGAYLSAFHNNILDDIFKNHTNKGYSKNKEINGYWTIKKIQEEANKCITRSEFWVKFPKAAKAAFKKNLTDEIFKNHTNKGYSENKSPYGYWTIEKLQEEANKYKTRKDFSICNSSAYHLSYKKNILDELFKNHKNEGYIDKKEWKENKYVIYAYEITEYNKVYIGLTNNIDRRDKEHIFNKTEYLINFCKEKNISLPQYKLLEENIKSAKAKKMEKYWVNYYKNKNWELFNIAKPGSLGGGKKIWNKELLQTIIKNYKTRGEFDSKNRSAYNAAIRNNLLDELFENHPNKGYTDKQVKSGYWTKEKLQDEANKCKNRCEFRKKLDRFNAAIRLNILDELFENHPNKGYSNNQVKSGYWTKEKLQNEANKYKTRQEFKNDNINCYTYAKIKKILNELFKNHPNQGYKRKKSE